MKTKGGKKHQEKNSAAEEEGKEGEKAPTMKEKGGSTSPEGKHLVSKCVENCKSGRNSGCPIKAKGRGKKANGNVGCADIDRMLEALGVDAKNASLCTKAGIMRGHIKLSGEEGDLEKVVHEDEGDCGHLIKATLGDLLKQPDYSNYDYELEKVTVICEVHHFYAYMVLNMMMLFSVNAHMNFFCLGIGSASHSISPRNVVNRT